MGGIKDGHFEAACDKDFKNAELLCTVKDTPGINYNHVILEKPVRGRYARFCSSAEGYAEVAEMHFIRRGRDCPYRQLGRCSSHSKYFCLSGL